MDLSEAPAALEAAGARVGQLPAEWAPEAAALILAAAKPPRRTGRLAESGRVEASSVVYGGGVVDYAAKVEAFTGFLARAEDAAHEAALDLAATTLSDAITL